MQLIVLDGQNSLCPGAVYGNISSPVAVDILHITACLLKNNRVELRRKHAALYGTDISYNIRRPRQAVIYAADIIRPINCLFPADIISRGQSRDRAFLFALNICKLLFDRLLPDCGGKRLFLNSPGVTVGCTPAVSANSKP